MTLISVIVTNYNHGQYLLKAIESIENQTLAKKDVEIIVVDDCSIDEETPEVLNWIESKKGDIKVIRRTSNLGKWNALNEGIAEAKGTYIALQDADDVSAPQRLELQLWQMNKLGSYHNVCGFQNILQDEDIDTVLSYPAVSKEDIPEPYGHKHTLEQCLMCWNAKEIKHYVASMHYEVCGASSIFYRRHWEAGMKFLPGNLGIRTQKGEDSDHNTRMTLLLQRTSILTLPLYGYRRGSTTNFSFQESI